VLNFRATLPRVRSVTRDNIDERDLLRITNNDSRRLSLAECISDGNRDGGAFFGFRRVSRAISQPVCPRWDALRETSLSLSLSLSLGIAVWQRKKYFAARE